MKQGAESSTLREPDYLDDLIEQSSKEPGFTQVWEPYRLVLQVLEERRRLKLTQAEIAHRMGVARPRVTELERNPGGVAFARIVAYVDAVGYRLELGARQPGKGGQPLLVKERRASRMKDQL